MKIMDYSSSMQPVVHVLDDDAQFLRSLLFMIDGKGFEVHG